MTIYVDQSRNWGWVMHGRQVQSCHMFSDALDLAELHAFALRLGLKREWFQNRPRAPHYDLVDSKRRMAVFLGAVEVDSRQAATLWRQRRDLIVARARDSLDTPPTTHELRGPITHV